MLEFLENVVLNTVGPALAIALAGLIGQHLSTRWVERQKKRDHELALANTFYASYGEFFAVQKNWHYALKNWERAPDELRVRRDALFERACRAEGGLESALLKIAAERVLTQQQRTDLGSLRQAFQVLRERIDEGVQIDYGASDHPDYLEFKRLATVVGVMLARPNAREPTPGAANDSFREITDNRHAQRWRTAGRRPQ